MAIPLLIKAGAGLAALFLVTRSAAKKTSGETTFVTGPSGRQYMIGIGEPNEQGSQFFNVMNASSGTPLLMYAQIPGGPRQLVSVQDAPGGSALDAEIEVALNDFQLGEN